MDFESMLVSLWVPFFVLLTLIPGSTLNAVERRTTKIRTTTAQQSSINLANTINKSKKEKPSSLLLYEAINDKTIQQIISSKSTQDFEEHRFGKRKELNERKAINMATSNAVGESHSTSPALTTALTSGGMAYKPSTTAMPMASGTIAAAVAMPDLSSTIETTGNRNEEISLSTETFELMNAGLLNGRKDLLNPPTKEHDSVSTITSTTLSSLQIALISASTSQIELEMTTNASIIGIPWGERTKVSTVPHTGAIEKPFVEMVEERTSNNNNYTERKTTLSTLSNTDNNNVNEIQRKFNMSVTPATKFERIHFADTTPSSLPPPLPSPKFLHGYHNRNQQQQHTEQEEKFFTKIHFNSHIFENAEHKTSASDTALNAKASNRSNILANETNTISNASLLSKQTTTIKDKLSTTTEFPSLTSKTTTTTAPTTTTTTMKTTAKPRRILATTTLKPPPTIDDYRTIISQAGTHAYLPCHVKQLVKKPISWLRVRDGHILTVDQTTFIADQRFQSIFSSDPERWSLQIKFVQPKDAGVYECQVSTEPKASAIVNLHIIEAKTEILGESTRHVKAGSQVKLRCIISQALEPPLFINWFYNQKQIYLHNHKGWRTEIERIDLPPETTTTTTTTTTTSTTSTTTPTPTPTTPATTIEPTTTPTIQMTTFPSLTVPMTVIAGVGEATFNGNDTGTAETTASTAVSESTTASTGATIAHFSSSPVYDGSTESVSSTFSTVPPEMSIEIERATLPTQRMTVATTMALSTLPALAMADIRQITAASLIIASVGKQDSGNYTCSPSNSAPKTVVLHVLNGEYSASAITSGCNGNVLMAFNFLSQWTTEILILLMIITLFA